MTLPSVYRELKAEILDLQKRFAAVLGVMTSGINQLTGDVTAGPGTGSQVATIPNNTVTNAKAADMAEARIKGRAVGAGTGDPQDLTGTQATAILDPFVGDSGSGGTKGLVPAPAAGDAAANKFLKADGTWAVGATSYTDEQAQDAVGTILTDTATVDFTYNDGAPSITADVIDDSITNAKAANMAQSTIKGRAAAAGTGDPQDLTANQVSTILDGATDPFVRTSAAAAGYTDEQAQDAVGTILNDSGDIDFTYDDATPKITATIKTGVRTTSMEITFDGNGSVIATNTKARFDVPVAATITKARILADQSGSIVLDVWKKAYASYPPTGSDSITASAKPTISSATKSEDSTLTGWTTSVSAGDTFIVNVDSCTTITQATLILTFSF